MLKQLAEVLWKHGSIYAIVDAARSKDVYEFLTSKATKSECLYKGKAAIEMAEFAPYLVAFQDHMELHKFLELSWGKSWGIMFASRSSSEDLKHFFRQFLLVDMPNGKKALFRFYDPRVFRDAFPGFEDSDRTRFLEMVTSFFVESSCSAKCLVLGRHSIENSHVESIEIDGEPC